SPRPPILKADRHTVFSEELQSPASNTSTTTLPSSPPSLSPPPPPPSSSASPALQCCSSCRSCVEVQGTCFTPRSREGLPAHTRAVSQSVSESVSDSVGPPPPPRRAAHPSVHLRSAADSLNLTMDSWTVTSALLLAGFISSAALNHFETECYTANGEDYRGLQNQTSLHAGKPCLFWNETFQHPYNTLKYPNGEGGLGSHNYCRNPDGDVQPWCYIADNEDSIYWRYCDIPSCQMPGNLGCFKDSGDPPTLSGTSETSNKLTIQNCISFCRKQRYKLAGMESGYACFCGNEGDLPAQDESPSMECNHVCFGDHTQPCGGDGWVIIFD
ncbi:unnamed protein product, partial [Pleuronectes platessa]